MPKGIQKKNKTKREQNQSDVPVEQVTIKSKTTMIHAMNLYDSSLSK